MNEDQWLSCSEPRTMLEALRASGKASDRKLRLFAVACARQVWHFIELESAKQSVEVAERFADGLATPDEFREARLALYGQFYKVEEDGRTMPRYSASSEAVFAKGAAFVTADGVIGTSNSWPAASRLTGPYQPNILRDIFGNLYRQAGIEDHWRTPTVVGLATAIYAKRSLPSGHLDASRLGVLADALEEAGCADQVVLTHFREPTLVHVRGCFALDLLLGKT